MINGAPVHQPQPTPSEICPGWLSRLPNGLEQMGRPINYPASQRHENNKAQERNTFVIPESDLQNAGSTRFLNFHAS
jgi:hypothetical protein